MSGPGRRRLVFVVAVDLLLFALAAGGLIACVWLLSLADSREPTERELASARLNLVGLAELVVLCVRLTLSGYVGRPWGRLPRSFWQSAGFVGREQVLVLDRNLATVSIALAQGQPGVSVTEIVGWSDRVRAYPRRDHLDRAQREGVADRIDFRYMEADRLPLPDESIDLVYVLRVPLLGFDGLLREMHRVLKPGGRLLIDGYLWPLGLTRSLRRTGLLPTSNWLVLREVRKPGNWCPPAEAVPPIVATYIPFIPEEEAPATSPT